MFTTSIPVSDLPILDGIAEDGEWDGGDLKKIELDNGQILDLTVIYTLTDMYFMARLSHDAPGDEIILDTRSIDRSTSIPHDYFGIEFDNNHDGAIMGTPQSPDDLIMVNYIDPGAIDMFSHSYHVFEDDGNSGRNDVEGLAGAENGSLFWEMRKPLTSSDPNGYDINLETGDKYYIMIAFWDDRPPHSPVGFVNIREGNSQFIEMIVGDAIDRSQENLIIFAVVTLSLFIGIIIIKIKSRKINKEI